MNNGAARHERRVGPNQYVQAVMSLPPLRHQPLDAAGAAIGTADPSTIWVAWRPRESRNDGDG